MGHVQDNSPLKNSWKVPHLCPTENPSRNLNKGNPNPKDVKLVLHKSFLMMLKRSKRGKSPN
jgi:hypothetical protein